MMEGDDVFTTPDDMVNAYNDITSDLAFAQTHLSQRHRIGVAPRPLSTQAHHGEADAAFLDP